MPKVAHPSAALSTAIAPHIGLEFTTSFVEVKKGSFATCRNIRETLVLWKTILLKKTRAGQVGNIISRQLDC